MSTRSLPRVWPETKIAAIKRRLDTAAPPKKGAPLSLRPATDEIAARETRLKRLRARKGGVLRFVRRITLLLVGVTVLPVLCLRWAPPPMSAFMLEHSVQAWLANERGSDLRYRWVDLNDISPELLLAAVAAEDQRFPQHFGFDLESIAEAWQENKDGKRLRGASTLSQQVAKNLFLWPDQSYLRKGLEAYFTGLIELLWPKRRILEVYLNIAQFGDGIFGVGAASEVFFQQPPARLNRGQSALLAAVLPNPLVYRAEQPSRYIMERQRWIVQQMRMLGSDYLSEVLD